MAGSITNSITLNRYAYANGNPVSNVDPFGLSPDEARGTQGTAISTDSAKNSWYTEEVSNAIHTILDIAGFIPGFGSVADGLNAVIYYFEGDLANAAISTFSAFFDFGTLAKAFVNAKKFLKSSSKIYKALDAVCTFINKFGNIAGVATEYSDEMADAGRAVGNALDSADVGKTVTYSSEFNEWLLSGDTKYKVYEGVTNGKPLYTGITSQTLEARLYQHQYNGKPFSDLVEKYSDVFTRNQARALEQYGIEFGANSLNQINSISPKSKYYSEAMSWAAEYINNLG